MKQRTLPIAVPPFPPRRLAPGGLSCISHRPAGRKGIPRPSRAVVRGCEKRSGYSGESVPAAPIVAPTHLATGVASLLLSWSRAALVFGPDEESPRPGQRVDGRHERCREPIPLPRAHRRLLGRGRRPAAG